MDFYDLDFATRRLCTSALFKDKKYVNLLCSYFQSLNDCEQTKFLELSGRFYNFIKCGSRKYKITKNSVYVADRIKHELKISCYPFIEKIATKSWSTSDGTFSWGMTLLNGCVEKELYSFEPVKLYLQKNTELNIGPYNGFAQVISIERLGDLHDS